MPSKRPIKRTRRKPQPSVSILNYRAARAAMLDRLADLELQQGRHRQAEHLAHRAAELRDARP